MKSSGPLLGYNNNIPYKGRVYHVQTEDSGTKRPHVITHLFADGGRIVSTSKTSYAELVDGDNLSEKVRALMREQHKKMVIALRDGEFDHLLETDGDAAHAAPTPVEQDLPPVELGREPQPARDDKDDGARSKPPVGDSPGTYSFVGARSSTPPRSRPPRPSVPPPGPRPRSAGTPPAGSPVTTGRTSDAPPAFDVTGPPTRRRQRSGTDGVRAHHAGDGSHGFGERWISERRFDEVVDAFLRREKLAREG